MFVSMLSSLLSGMSRRRSSAETCCTLERAVALDLGDAARAGFSSYWP